MKIEIKNLKFSDFASHETHCFEATVYVDGKRSFVASNDGQGGCNNYHGLPAKRAKAGEEITVTVSEFKPRTVDVVGEQVQKINDYLKTLPAEVTDIKNSDGTFFEYQKDLDGVIANLVNDALSAKELKRILRKIVVLTDDGSIGTYPAKYKPTAEAFAVVEKHDGIKVVLNRLPFDEALKIFKEAA